MCPNPTDFEFHKTPEDLGIAVADFFRKKSSSIDSIDATKRIEGVDISIKIPHTEFTEKNIILYDRFSAMEYIRTIKQMTEAVDGKK